MNLTRGLSVEAEKLGHQDESRKYHLTFLSAQKDHLLAGVRAENSWYEDHFPTVERILAVLALVWYLINAILWKHGESATRLLFSAVSVVFVIFPLLYAVADRGPNVYSDLLWLSLSNFLLLERLYTGAISTVSVAALSASEAALGILFAGMYVSVLLKALLRR